MNKNSGSSFWDFSRARGRVVILTLLTGGLLGTYEACVNLNLKGKLVSAWSSLLTALAVLLLDFIVAFVIVLFYEFVLNIFKRGERTEFLNSLQISLSLSTLLSLYLSNEIFQGYIIERDYPFFLDLIVMLLIYVIILGVITSVLLFLIKMFKGIYKPVMKYILLTICVLLIMFFWLRYHLPEMGEGEVIDKPNVVLISIDALNYFHSSLNGYDKPTMPNIEELAEECVYFNNVSCPMPETGPSHTTMLTGFPIREHLVVNNGIPLRDNFTTISEYLHYKGYNTGAIVSGFTLVDNMCNLSQGFEHYDDRFSLIHPLNTSLIYNILYHLKLLSEPMKMCGDKVTEKGIKLVDGFIEKNQPFFLFLHYYEPHNPLRPPTEDQFLVPEEGKYLLEESPLERDEWWYGTDNSLLEEDEIKGMVGIYDAEVHHVDRIVGEFIDYLKLMDIYDETIIIITADHGEGQTDHPFIQSSFDKTFYYSNKGHGMGQFDDQILVSILIKPDISNDNFEPGITLTSQEELADIPKTICGMLGYYESPFSSVDLWNEVLLGDNIDDRWSFTQSGPIPVDVDGSNEMRSLIFSMRSSNHKIIYYVCDEKISIYDLREDPREQTDIFDEVREDFQDEIKELVRFAVEHTHIEGDLKLSQREKEQLRGLGYVF